MGDKAPVRKRIDRGPSRVLLAWLFAVIALCVVSGFSLYRLDRSAGPMPTASYPAGPQTAGHADP
jgi:hypothetical protein